MALDDQSGGARRHQMCVQKAVVVRRDVDVVQLRQRRQLAAHREAAHARAIELQYADRLFLEQRAATVGAVLAFTRRQRNIGILRQQLQQPPIVVPMHRFFKPARIDLRQLLDRGQRHRQVPAAIDVDHQLGVIADDLAHHPQPLHVFLERERTDLGLERGMPLRLEHMHFIAQLVEVLAVAVIGAGDVTGHPVAVTAEQPVKRLAGTLANQVPAGDIDRRRGQHQLRLAPALVGGDSLPGDRDQLAVKPLRGQRVGADDEVLQAIGEHFRGRLERGVAAAEAKTRQAVLGVQYHQEFVGRGHRKVAHPVRPLFARAAENIDFDCGNFHFLQAARGLNICTDYAAANAGMRGDYAARTRPGAGVG